MRHRREMQEGNRPPLTIMATGFGRSGVVTTDNLDSNSLRTSWPCLVRGDRAFRPEGFGLLPSGEFVISDSINDRIKVFSAEGRFKRYIGHKGKSRVRGPQALAVFRNGWIAAFDKADSSIKVYTSDGTLRKRIAGAEIERPVPLAVSPDDQIVLPTSHGIIFISLDDTDSKHVVNVDTDLDLSQSRGILVTSRFVILSGVSGDDILYVTHEGHIHRHVSFSEVTDTQSGLKSSFFGMCTYKNDDNLVVADADNNRLLLVTSRQADELRLRAFDCDAWLRLAMSDYDYSQLRRVLLCPKFLAVNQSGNLLVLENLGALKEFSVPYLKELASPPATPDSVSTTTPLLNPHGYVTDPTAIDQVYMCC